MTTRQEQIVKELAAIDFSRTRRIEELVSLAPGQTDRLEQICNELDRMHHNTIVLGREFAAIEGR